MLLEEDVSGFRNEDCFRKFQNFVGIVLREHSVHKDDEESKILVPFTVLMLVASKSGAFFFFILN